jgi:hypothetical protein
MFADYNKIGNTARNSGGGPMAYVVLVCKRIIV